MEAAESWRSLFENWPNSMPRKGLLITTFQESIPFVNFMISGGLVLLDRDKPDTTGARKVIVAYSAISAIKFTDVLEMARFQVLGFQPPL